MNSSNSMKLAILETCPRAVGSATMHWKKIYSANSDGFTSAGQDRANLRKPPEDFLYSDRAQAEKDADKFRADNARQVENTKRCRGANKTLPSTVEIIEIKA
jgi:hypothetical protein